MLGKCASSWTKFTTMFRQRSLIRRMTYQPLHILIFHHNPSIYFELSLSLRTYISNPLLQKTFFKELDIVAYLSSPHTIESDPPPIVPKIVPRDLFLPSLKAPLSSLFVCVSTVHSGNRKLSNHLRFILCNLDNEYLLRMIIDSDMMLEEEHMLNDRLNFQRAVVSLLLSYLS